MDIQLPPETITRSVTVPEIQTNTDVVDVTDIEVLEVSWTERELGFYVMKLGYSSKGISLKNNLWRMSRH